MYIAIEGLDGTGKSTLIEYLKEYEKDARFIREPFNNVLMQKVKDIFPRLNNAAMSNFQMALRCLEKENLKKYKKQDKLTISDRSFLSTCVYQGKMMPLYKEKLFCKEKIKNENARVLLERIGSLITISNDFDFKMMAKSTVLAEDCRKSSIEIPIIDIMQILKIPIPDKIVYLYVDKEIRKERMISRGELSEFDKISLDKHSYFNSIYQNVLKEIEENDLSEVIKINASKLNPCELSLKVLEMIK